MMYSIPEINMEGLEKKLRRIENKCLKYGCEFKYERVGEHFEKRKYKDDRGVVREENVKYIDIDVEGKAEVNGWRFAASLEYTDKGNVIQGVEGIEIPDRYYSCSPWCEHCKTRRDRKNSYIVFNEETGEFKQVGKSCLKDFTHGLSAEAVAQFESWFKEVEEASEFSGWGSFGGSYFDVKDFMVCAAETIRLFGYVKRDFNGLCTADLTEMLYRIENNMRVWGDRKAWEETYEDAVSRGFNTKNPDSVELAGKVRDWIVNNDREDNYFHNLKVACSLDCCESKFLGLLVSAFPAFNRELERDAERKEKALKEAEAAAKSSWLGEVGDKVSFKIADYFLISSWETQWGYTYVFRFKDEEGHEATWKTGSWFDDDVVGKTITGKIKELKEFRGIKQTELTRCRVA